MSIASEIGRIRTNIAGAYSACRAKGAAIPASQNSANLTAAIQSIVTDDDSANAGLQVDLENRVFTRLAGAVGKTAGADFDAFAMYGGRRRCNVANDGTVNAYYGDSGYTEDGSNGQVMVYQPAFWYKVVPLKTEKNTDRLGYHIRKANYYVSAAAKPGFKLHPLFYDANGNAVDYVLLSAYEGSMYDVSASAYVNDNVDSVSYAAGDMLCSVAGKKPISGKLTGIGTKTNLETMAGNRGTGWHLETIKALAANQLLMMIETATVNSQSAIGAGCVNLPHTDGKNCAANTGSTASLGNATGAASSTTVNIDGVTTAYTDSDKVAVSYRGFENPWGNIGKHINGVNFWGDGTMGGGQVFIADDFNFNESRHSDNYSSAGFSVANANGFITAFGCGYERYDWLLLPSEVSNSSGQAVGDYSWSTANVDGNRVLRAGGSWNQGDSCGAFTANMATAVNYRASIVNGRLLYVPTAAV